MSKLIYNGQSISLTIGLPAYPNIAPYLSGPTMWKVEVINQDGAAILDEEALQPVGTPTLEAITGVHILKWNPVVKGILNPTGPDTESPIGQALSLGGFKFTAEFEPSADDEDQDDGDGDDSCDCDECTSTDRDNVMDALSSISSALEKIDSRLDNLESRVG